MSYGLFSSGEAPLGSYAQFASFRSLIQEADGKNYLRVGSVVPASFADAKLMVKSDYVFLPQLVTNDVAGTGHCDSGTVVLFRLDGSGNYRRSADDLLTSTNETWPATYIPATPIRWTGTRFVVGAYVSAGGLFMLSSATGLTGSWTITTIVAGAFSGPQEMWLEFAPLAPAFMVCTYCNTSSNQYGVYSSADSGTTWATRLTSASQQYRKPVCLGSGPAGRWIIPFGGFNPFLLADAFTMPADFSAAPVANALARQIPQLGECFTDGTNIVAVDKTTGADLYSVDGLDWESFRQVDLPLTNCSLNRCAGAFWKFVNINSEPTSSTTYTPSQHVLRSVDGKTWFQKNTGLGYLVGSSAQARQGFVTQSLKVVGSANRQLLSNNHALAGWNQATHIGSLTPSGALDNTGFTNGARFPETFMRIK